jgi:hypothetical protein
VTPMDDELELEEEPEEITMMGYEFYPSTDPAEERDAYRERSIIVETHLLREIWAWKAWAIITTVLWIIVSFMYLAERLK